MEEKNITKQKQSSNDARSFLNLSTNKNFLSFHVNVTHVNGLPTIDMPVMYQFTCTDLESHW